MPLPGRPDIGVTRPDKARVYDYWLGGKDNFAADREAGEAILKEHPGLRAMARQNRSFILKSVRWTASVAGIAQFIDAGCGLPSRPFVHEAARLGEPSARVAYVDRDPFVMSHVRAIEVTGDGLAAVEADVTEPARVLGDRGLLEVIDLARPAALVLGGTLSDMPADTARAVVAEFAGALAPGSAVIISCASFAGREVAERIAAVLAPDGGWRNHSPEDVGSFFAAGGLRILHGRVMDVSCWPACPAGDGAEPGAQVLGGIGVRD